MTPDSAPEKANQMQIGGNHYKELDPQPWDLIRAWNLGYMEGNVIKYVGRWQSKGGLEDLRKARHYLDKLIEYEMGAEIKGTQGRTTVALHKQKK